MTERLYGGAEKIEVNGDGMVRYKGLIWARCTARKRTTCWLTGNEIEPGASVYRPLTNGSDRYRRIKATTWDRPATAVLQGR